MLKGSHLFAPFIVINLYKNRLFRIGLLQNGNLITDYSEIAFGTAMSICPLHEKIKDLDRDLENCI